MTRGAPRSQSRTEHQERLVSSLSSDAVPCKSSSCSQSATFSGQIGSIRVARMFSKASSAWASQLPGWQSPPSDSSELLLLSSLLPSLLPSSRLSSLLRPSPLLSALLAELGRLPSTLLVCSAAEAGRAAAGPGLPVLGLVTGARKRAETSGCELLRAFLLPRGACKGSQLRLALGCVRPGGNRCFLFPGGIGSTCSPKCCQAGDGWEKSLWYINICTFAAESVLHGLEVAMEA